MELLGHYSNKGRTPILPLTSEDAPLQGVSASPAVQPQHHLRPSDMEAILAAYRGGAAVQELAGQWKVHRNTVRELLNRAGVERRQTGLHGNEREAVRLYRDGWSLTKIAEKYEVATSTVSRHLAQLGVARRPASGR